MGPLLPPAVHSYCVLSSKQSLRGLRNSILLASVQTFRNTRLVGKHGAARDHRLAMPSFIQHQVRGNQQATPIYCVLYPSSTTKATKLLRIDVKSASAKISGTDWHGRRALSMCGNRTTEHPLRPLFSTSNFGGCSMYVCACHLLGACVSRARPITWPGRCWLG